MKLTKENTGKVVGIVGQKGPPGLLLFKHGAVIVHLPLGPVRLAEDACKSKSRPLVVLALFHDTCS